MATNPAVLGGQLIGEWFYTALRNLDLEEVTTKGGDVGPPYAMLPADVRDRLKRAGNAVIAEMRGANLLPPVVLKKTEVPATPPALNVPRGNQVANQ